MLKKVKNFALVAMLAVGGLMAANTAAYAQPCHCEIVDGCKVITFYDDFGNVIGQETVCPSTGTGDFNCDFLEIPPTGPINVSIPPVQITATGNSQDYGPITTNIDPDRVSSNAIIRSITEARFPLYVRFSFYARTTVAGVEYCSREELVFSSRNVRSFRPFKQERFCLEQDAEFVRCDDPSGPTAFVLAAGSSCVTLN